MSLDVILIDFLRLGRTPGQIAESLPTVPLSHIYGAIAYYYEHQSLMDEYLAEGDQIEASIPPLSQRNPELFVRMEAARKRLQQKTA